MPEPCPQPLDIVRIGKIGLGEHDAVGDGGLLHSLDMAIERGLAVDGIDQRDDAIEPESLHQRWMRHDRLQHWCGVGKTGGFDHDTGKPGDTTGLQPVDEVGQCVDEIATHGAAEAAVGKLDDAVRGLLDQQVVDRHLAELVDDDRRVGQRRILEQPVEQRRLAGTEKAGEHRDGDGEAAAHRPVTG